MIVDELVAWVHPSAALVIIKSPDVGSYVAPLGVHWAVEPAPVTTNPVPVRTELDKALTKVCWYLALGSAVPTLIVILAPEVEITGRYVLCAGSADEYPVPPLIVVIPVIIPALDPVPTVAWSFAADPIPNGLKISTLTGPDWYPEPAANIVTLWTEPAALITAVAAAATLGW